MRGHFCEDCAYSQGKGEPSGPGWCSFCVPDACDKCGKELGSPRISIGDKDYHIGCYGRRER